MGFDDKHESFIFLEIIDVIVDTFLGVAQEVIGFNDSLLLLLGLHLLG